MKAPICITEYQDLRSCTTIGIGGAARYFASATSVEDLRQVAHFSHEKGLPLCILGRGSNVLVQDECLEVIVVVLGGCFRKIEFDTCEHIVSAGAGASLIKLGVQLARQGYGGCAFMGVIPGSVGGAVRMNAGTGPGQEISSHLVRARVFDPAAVRENWMGPDELQFSYRQSALARLQHILVEAVFKLPEKRGKLQPAPIDAIQQLYRRRRALQPCSRKTFGSVFKNPAGAAHSAGWYLEQAGMKGMRCGGAMVPVEHANWIVNTGGATALEVQQLIDAGRQRTADQFGIQLEREVVYFPQDVSSSAALPG